MYTLILFISIYFSILPSTNFNFCNIIVTFISIRISFPSFPSSYIRPHKMSGVTSSFIGSVQQVFVNGNPLSLYGAETAKCSIVQDEDRLPCATTGVTKYTGPPCGEGEQIQKQLDIHIS